MGRKAAAFRTGGPMKAVICAFDRCPRLDPFTPTRPAALIPVLNEPVLGHMLEEARGAGVSEVVILEGYLKDMVREYVKDGSRWGIPVRFQEVSGRGEFLPVLKTVVKAGDGPLLLVDGTLFCEKGFLRLVVEKAACAGNAGIVGLGTSLNPLYHLRAGVGTQGDISSLQDVRLSDIRIGQQSPLEDIVAGAAVLDGKLISGISGTEDIAAVPDVIRRCVAEGACLKAARTGRRLVSIEYPWEILAANYLGLDLFFSSRPAGRYISPSAMIAPGVVMQGLVIVKENVRVETGAVLRDCVLGAGTVIQEYSYVVRSFVGEQAGVGPMGYVSGSVLGPQGRVGFPGEFPVAVSLGKAGFGHHCHAGMGVYGEGSGLAAGAIVTANRENPVKVKIEGKLVDSGWYNLGAFVGDRCRINGNATVMPGRKIGPGSVIGPGVVVYRDVKPRTRVVLKQEIEEQEISP